LTGQYAASVWMSIPNYILVGQNQPIEDNGKGY
jgi:hypothetical protein